MSCNQKIISCKSAIPLLLRDHCRNSQFLFPSPYFLIIEEERTCEGITQLNSGQTNLTKTEFFCSHVIFSLRAPRIFSRNVLKTPRLCLCSAKEGGGDDPVVNLNLFWVKHFVPSQQLCGLFLFVLPSCRKTHPSLLSWALLQKSEQNNVVHLVTFLLVRDKK